MTSKFFFFFDLLNLLSFFFKKQIEVIEKLSFRMTKIVNVYQYNNNNDSYQNKAKLYQQVVSKALPITKVLYLDYLLVLLFNNITCYFVYVKHVLYIKNKQKLVKNQVLL